MGRDFLPAFLGAVPVSVSVWSTRLCLMFQLPGLVSVLVLVWSTRPGEQPGGTPLIRDRPIWSSYLDLSRSTPQCRLPVLTSVDVPRLNSLLMPTTKRPKWKI